MMATADVLLARTAHMQLDDLINRNRTQLDELYHMATTPRVVEVIGKTRGRILSGAIPWLLTAQSGRYLVNQPWLLWRGAQFEPINSQHGRGAHRFGLGRWERQALPFETAVTAPLFGRDDVLMLGYDLPGNPPGARRFRDDLKKLRDGLYLGATFFYWGGVHRFIAYFGLEFE